MTRNNTRKHKYYVYMMASKSGVLYIGVTNSLIHRVLEHKNGLVEGFTKKYKCQKLVYYEETDDISAAIAREKQLKKWRREKKVKLIDTINPGWKDLSEE
ncbi:MAG: GIY-YIG nuclease family protein [Patescibacteria group bacterium]